MSVPQFLPSEEYLQQAILLLGLSSQFGKFIKPDQTRIIHYQRENQRKYANIARVSLRQLLSGIQGLMQSLGKQ